MKEDLILSSLRRDLFLSIKQAAELCGCTPQAWGRYERGERPTPSQYKSKLQLLRHRRQQMIAAICANDTGSIIIPVAPLHPIMSAIQTSAIPQLLDAGVVIITTTPYDSYCIEINSRLAITPFLPDHPDHIDNPQPVHIR